VNRKFRQTGAILLFILILTSFSQKTLAKDPDSPLHPFGLLLHTTWTLDDIDGGSTASGDRFGEAITNGDFNGDGWQDLAIGVPAATVPLFSIQNAGMVVVLYGTGVGLRGDAAHRQYVWQIMDSDGTETDDFFGSALASGDFNGDGYDDLAVGTPNEDVSLGFLGDRFDAGAVNIYPGSAAGLLTDEADSLYLRQGDMYTNVSNADAVDALDYFGRSLTTGDFNNDGYQDLAIGVPGENFGNNNQVSNAGMFHVVYGFTGFFQGIDASTNTNISQNSFGVEDSSENGDNMGQALASGDFDDDGYDDLAVGVPGENPDNVFAAGAVQVFPGGPTGLDTTNDSLWSQASPSVVGVPESTDRFGKALASADFDNDGYDDLLVGVPNEDVGSINNAGAINVLYGSTLGLTATGNQLFTQDSPGITDVAEAGDSFGAQLAAVGFIYVPPFPQTSGQFGTSLLAADFGNGTEVAIGEPGYTSADNEFEFLRTRLNKKHRLRTENNPARRGVFPARTFSLPGLSATIGR